MTEDTERPLKLPKPHEIERMTLDIYDDDPRPAVDASANTSAAVADAADRLLRSDDGRAFVGLAQTVGYAVAGLTIELPSDSLEHVIQEVMRRLRAEMIATATTEQETFDTKEAAAFLRTSEQRIYDLVSKRKLRPEFKDGKKNIFQRKELEAYLRGEGRRGNTR